MSTARNIGREIGTAFAVLAIYLLTVLAPLHQARASQLAFEELGYAMPQSSWMVCTPAGMDGGDGEVSVAKCPATGVGKAETVLPGQCALPDAYGIALAAPRLTAIDTVPLRRLASPAGPRAPPVAV